jgi:Domain of unknown function (DUF4129)
VVWDADSVRGARDTARLITVAVVVLSALTLIALAARSDRAPTLAPIRVAPSPTAVVAPPAGSATPVPDGGQAAPVESTPLHQPNWVIWFVMIMAIAPLLLALFLAPAMLWLPNGGLWFGRREARSAEPPEVEDEVAPPPLADAVAEGLRELDQGGPGEGVVACWVQLERAAADAGTHRAAPETASELVGRLIDRHPVSSAPLLRLADLYREARYSRHEQPESARTEARAALEQLQAELVASPAGSR